MIKDKNSNAFTSINSCVSNIIIEGEEFIDEHFFSFQISGELIINEEKKKHHFLPGNFRLSKKNSLAKFKKIETEQEKFQSVHICLDQKNLLEIYNLFKFKIDQKKYQNESVIPILSHELYLSFINSYRVYLDLSEKSRFHFMDLKVKEIIFLLLQLNPELKDVLFNFKEPGKIDLEAFMTKNFHYNIPLKRFAYLTGRSLSTFKRDFEKTFNTVPGKWLLEKRLYEAHFLIEEKKLKPKDFYLEIGFENLPHFYYAYKNKFGANSSRQE